MKKGILESNVFSMILVVVAMGLVLFFVVNKTRGDTGRAQEENGPKVFVEKLEAYSESLAVGESVEKKILGFDKVNEPTWFLVVFGKDDAGAPESRECILKSCVCVCENDCAEKPICRSVSVPDIELNYYSIEVIPPTFVGGPGGIGGGMDDPGSKIEHKLPLPNKMLKLDISKTDEGVKINYYSEEYLSQYGKNEPTG